MTTPYEPPRYARVLIDADGYVFKSSLLRKGFQGGVTAARILEDYVRLLMDKVGVRSPKQCTVLVRLFCNKLYLENYLLRENRVQNRQIMRDFFNGFLASHRNWTISDCGTLKEAADKSLLETLKMYTVSTDSSEIYVLGCGHDVGYISGPELHDHRIRDKLYIIKGDKVARDMKENQLSFVGFPALFEPFADRVEPEIILGNPESRIMPPAAPLKPPQNEAGRQQKRTRDAFPGEASQPPKRAIPANIVGFHNRQEDPGASDSLFREAQAKLEYEQPETQQQEATQLEAGSIVDAVGTSSDRAKTYVPSLPANNLASTSHINIQQTTDNRNVYAKEEHRLPDEQTKSSNIPFARRYIQDGQEIWYDAYSRRVDVHAFEKVDWKPVQIAVESVERDTVCVEGALKELCKVQNCEKRHFAKPFSNTVIKRIEIYYRHRAGPCKNSSACRDPKCRFSHHCPFLNHRCDALKCPYRTRYTISQSIKGEEYDRIAWSFRERRFDLISYQEIECKQHYGWRV